MKKAYQVKRIPLRHNGVRFLDGDIIDADQLEAAHAKRLIAMGAIVEVAVNDEVVVVTVNPDGQQAVQTDEEPVNVTLDVNFSHPELVEGAKDEGLTFRNNISKKALIELIIENGKENYFLDQLED